MAIHGHEVSIEKGDDGLVLKVDGKELLSNYYIFLDRVTAVDGVNVATGRVSAGGNACEGAPYVLVLEAGKAARVDGPLDTCEPIEPKEEAGRLLFEETAIPGQESKRWSWTPRDGFASLEAATFKPDAAKGWPELARDAIGHPADILGYGAVALEIDNLLGKDKATFESFVTGLGSAKREGKLVSGSACIKYDCPDNASLLVADTASRKVYLAWKPTGEKIVVRPPVGEWPAAPRAKLREWATPWN